MHLRILSGWWTCPATGARVARAVLITLLSVVALILLASWGVPKLMRWQITSRGTELLGRQVSVGHIRFLPWRLATEIDDLSVAARTSPGVADVVNAQGSTPTPVAAPGDEPVEPTTQSPTFTVAQLRFRIAPASIWKLAPVVAELSIDEPHLRIARTRDGSYNIDDIITRLSTKPATPDTATVPRFSLRGARIKAGVVDFDDQGVRREVRDLVLALPFIGTLNDAERDRGVQPRLAFTLDGSHFDSVGEATPFADVRAGEFTLTVKDLDLARWRTYLPASVPVRLAAGRLDASITLDWTQRETEIQVAPGGTVADAAATAGAPLSDPTTAASTDATSSAASVTAPNMKKTVAKKAVAARPLLDVRGDLTLRKLQLTDAADAALASADALSVSLAHLDIFGRKAEITRIALDSPRFAIDRRADGSIRGFESAPTVSAPTSSAPTTAPTPAATLSKTPNWQIGLREWIVRDGSADFTDASVASSVRLGLRALNLQAGPAAYPLLQPVAFHLSTDVLEGGADAPSPTVADSAPRAGAAEKTAAATSVGASISGGEDSARSEGAQTDDSTADAAAKAAPQPVSANSGTGNGTGNGTDMSRSPAAAAASGRAHIDVRGTALAAQGQATIAIDRLPLGLARAYLAAVLRPTLSGSVDARLVAQWAPPGWMVDIASARASQLKLADGRATLAGAAAIAVNDTQVDGMSHSVRIGSLEMRAPQAAVARDANGRWMAQDWLVDAGKKSAPAAPAGSTASTAPLAAPNASRPWTLALGKASIANGSFDWLDGKLARPVKLAVRGVHAQLGQLAWPATAAAAPSTLELSLRLGADTAAAAANADSMASLNYQGTVGLEPFALKGQLKLERLPMPAFEPYFADLLNVQVTRADLGFDGKIEVNFPSAGPGLQLRGALSLDDGRLDSAAPDAPATAPNPAGAAGTSLTKNTVRTRGALNAGSARANTLFSWKTLAFKDLSVDVAPGTATRASVGGTTLADFFARIAVDETGRINLQDIVRDKTKNLATEKVAGGAIQSGAGELKDTEKKSSASSASGAGSAAASPSAVLQFGPTTFTNGRVQFTDQFVKPSYSASLTELNGSLGAFGNSGTVGKADAATPQSREAVSLASLELHGKAEGSASLDVTGALNPLATPLALDITAKVRNLELPPLSPYSVKYAGHGIERGKLDMDVTYKIEPNGQLTARNGLVLRQLVFGDEVDGGGNSLPVKLATALLADSNGVIDLDIPISGSLSDPQFSLGPIIGKALLNILGRAITAPFSLLSSALRGATQGPDGEAVVAFEPGSATLDASADTQVKEIAAAMEKRPKIDLTITGHAGLAAEQAGYRQTRLRRLLAFIKRRENLAAASRAGGASMPPTGNAAPALPVVSEADYPRLLRQLYDRTDMQKPRNAIGMARELPVPEMENLLLGQIDVGPQHMRELAVQRAGEVRDALAKAGVAAERLFLGLPDVQTAASAPAGASKPDVLPPGRATLKLAMH